MNKIIAIIGLACFALQVQAQELFVYTEPASNVPARSLGLRLTQQIPMQKAGSAVGYQALPEIVWGASAKLMLHAEGFINNRGGTVGFDGASLYGKYRFYSRDDIHRHFRMAFFGRLSYNRGTIMQEAIDVNGQNSGMEWGWIGTKLIDRLAISGTVSWLNAFDNGSAQTKKWPSAYRDALGFSLSAGRLMLPTVYKDYDQVNLNLMLETLGQANLKNGEMFLDLAPSLQLIFKSRMRIDLGYRFAVVKDLDRPVKRMALLRFEYNIFNAF